MEYEQIKIHKKIEQAKHAKFCAEQKMHQADIKIAEYDLQLLELDNKKIEEVATEKPKSIRGYGQSRIKGMPIITEVKNDGTLISDKGFTLRAYNIYDLLKLKKNIPNFLKYPSMKKLAMSTGLSETTGTKLCAGIELGMYDHIFNKWEQMVRS